MNKKTPILIAMGIVLLLIGAVIFTRFSPMFATTASEDLWYGYGGAMQCGNFYSSKLYDYEDFADYCEGIGYDCFLDNYPSTVDGRTIYEVSCQEYCYSCEDGEEYIWAVAPNCEGDELTDMPTADVQTYFSNPNAYNPGGSKDFGYCGTEITCYQCYNGRISSFTDIADSCPSGWTATPPTCETAEEITCYQCQDGESVSKKFDNVCGAGWFTSQVPCTNEVVCYTCEDSQLRSKTFEGGCNLPYQATQPNCGSENLIACDMCVDGILQGGDFVNDCPTGYQETMTPPRSCGVLSGGIKELFDFQNKPGQAVGLIALIIVFLGLMIKAVRPKTSAVRL